MPVLFGSGREKTLRIVEEFGPKEYYNFSAGIDTGLHVAEDYTKRGIILYKQDYQHPVYDQGPIEFIPYLSILDLLFRYSAEESLEIIRKGRNWIIMN